jgi:CRP-like cAMP-binding protein
MHASTQVDPPAASRAPLSSLRDILHAAAAVPLPGWSEVEAQVTACTLPRGGVAFHQHAVHPFVYAVRRGLIKLVYLDAHGGEWIKSFIAEGELFASIAALAPGGRTTFMAAAIEPADLERVPFAVLEANAAAYLLWARALQRLTLSFAARKEQRERQLLTLDAEARYLELARHCPRLLERVPQKDLARHLGVTPVGLSRIVVRVRRRR